MCACIPPELEELAHGAQARLREEFARLRRHGIPADHTWSAALVPLIWLSLPAYGHRLLLPALVREAIDLRPARHLTAFWHRQGVQLPEDFVAWLYGRYHMGGHGGTLQASGYLTATPQEQILALAQTRTIRREGALRGPAGPPAMAGSNLP